MLHYETLKGSLYNTPPCWSIYICGLVFKHLLSQVAPPAPCTFTCTWVSSLIEQS